MAKATHNTAPQSTNLDDLFDNIPDSILPEIFKRLPVKTLLACACVQKSWNYFIKTPIFINIHLNYNPRPNSLLFVSNYTCELSLRYDNQHCQEFRKLELPDCIRLFTNWRSTSYSLICFSTVHSRRSITNYTGQFILFNPLIRKYKTLPDLVSPSTIDDTRCVFLAFGYVSLIDDYRVVKIVSYSDANNVQLLSTYVYSLRTNSWTTKTVRDDLFAKMTCNTYETVFVNGVAFWRALYENRVERILCFDTIDGVLRNIAVPRNDDCYYPLLQQFDQSVAYFANGPEIEDISMWILRGDPMKDFFWEKKFTARLDEDISTEVLGIRNNGELIFSKLYDCDLVSYNWEDDEVKNFVCSWNRWSMIGMDGKNMDDYKYKDPSFVIRPFVEGLVLLDDD